jgi:hypothetical protein
MLSQFAKIYSLDARLIRRGGLSSISSYGSALGGRYQATNSKDPSFGRDDKSPKRSVILNYALR